MYERHANMYEVLIVSLKSIMIAIAELGTGHLPPEIFTLIPLYFNHVSIGFGSILT